jgi:cell division protein FtsQ
MFARSSAQALLLREDAANRINWVWVRRSSYLLVALAALGWMWHTINDPRTLPVRKIHAVGTFVHVNEQMLRDAVAAAVDGGYFRLDVDMVKQAVEKIAWIDTVRVRRVWPDTLSIEVQEQVALARLAGGGLVNLRGGPAYIYQSGRN